MDLDQAEFDLTEFRRFAEDLRRDGDLADVMDGGGDADEVRPVL